MIEFILENEVDLNLIGKAICEEVSINLSQVMFTHDITKEDGDFKDKIIVESARVQGSFNQQISIYHANSLSFGLEFLRRLSNRLNCKILAMENVSQNPFEVQLVEPGSQVTTVFLDPDSLDEEKYMIQSIDV